MNVAMTGNDTIMINNRLLTNLADGEVVNLTFPNDIAQLKTGKNGNTLYALNASGKQADAKIRVLRGSDDDIYLNNLMAQMESNFAAFPLLEGEFIKQVGIGGGKVKQDIYDMGGGIFTKRIEAKSNVEGDTEQSVAVYSMRFSNAPRTIG